jgi:hypothetical protein
LSKGQPKPARPSVRLGPSASRTIHQQIELLPAFGSRTLVALEPTVMLSNAVGYSLKGKAPLRLVEVPDEQVSFSEGAVGYSYHAYSLPPGAARAAPEPIDRDRYLALPATLDPRVRALAQRVVGTEREPLAAARLLERFLRAEYRYTLELPGELADPLADFLFVRKAGHCEQFATALAVLLRAAGFPARVAAGFFGGERVGNQYGVRAADAHAWVQVYLPGQGFFSIDATPEEGRSGQPAWWLEWLTRSYERIDSFWRNRVLDYSLQDQLEITRALVRPPQARGPGATRWVPPARAWLILAVIALLAYGVWRTGQWRRRERPHPAAWLAPAIERALLAAQVSPRPDEGLEELSTRLTREGHPIAAPLARVTRRYLEARFGGRPLAPGEGQALLRWLRRPARPVSRAA